MIYSVVMQLRWLPYEIDSLYLDGQDHWGLEYWYDHIEEYSKKLETAAKAK